MMASSGNSSSSSRKETERTKLIQEKCQTLLTQMLRDEDNKYCVDCDAKGPRWASWNLGVFLCIRCAGIHRNLGVHISRVKSVNLDTWTPEQVISLQQMGNSRARAVYEAQLPDGFRRPQTDTALESFIRAKYEHKKYLAREWVPPSPPKIDWAKEIDDELERQKRKKKAAQVNSAIPLGIGTLVSSGDKKLIPKVVPLPAPLPKPKSSSSPKTQRNSGNSSGVTNTNLTNVVSSLSTTAATTISNYHSSDLLGLASPTKLLHNSLATTSSSNAINDLQNDSFSCFLSATPTSINNNIDNPNSTVATANNSNCNQDSSLAKEEQDFFNQYSLQQQQNNGSENVVEKGVTGKLSKDSILALYGQIPQNYLHHASLQQQQQIGLFAHHALGSGNGTAGGNFTGLTPGTYMGAGGPMSIPQHHHQQHHPQQFMTPPNSASMYNSPVMTAPTAFTAPGIGGVSASAVSSTNIQMNSIPGQFTAGSHVNSFMPTQNFGPGVGGSGSGIMATGLGQNPNNLMPTNHQLSFSNSMMMFPGSPAVPTISQMQSVFPQTLNGAPSAGTTHLQQQFGNLNMSNVWQ